MENNPKENDDQEAAQKGLPKRDALPIVEGSDKPVDKAITPNNSGGGANQPPRENNNLTEPEGPGGNKKWTRDDKFKFWTLVIGGLGLVGTIWALTNTTNTLNANRKEFEISNRPFIELGDIKVDSTALGQRPIISFSLTNKGRFPALVLDYRCYIGVSSQSITPDSTIREAENFVVLGKDSSIGIIPFSPAVSPQKIQQAIPLTEDHLKVIASMQAAICLIVKIKYVNLVTKAPYLFIEVFRITPSPKLLIKGVKYIDDPQ